MRDNPWQGHRARGRSGAVVGIMMGRKSGTRARGTDYGKRWKRSHMGAIRGCSMPDWMPSDARGPLATVEVEIYLLRVVQMLLWELAALACALLAIGIRPGQRGGRVG